MFGRSNPKTYSNRIFGRFILFGYFLKGYLDVKIPKTIQMAYLDVLLPLEIFLKGYLDVIIPFENFLKAYLVVIVPLDIFLKPY